MSASVCKESLCPAASVPFCIVVIVGVLAVVDFYHSYGRIAVLVECNVPEPVSAVGSSVNDCSRVGVGKRFGLVHLERTVVNTREHLSVDVFHLFSVNVEGIEVQPVRIFVVWVSRSVAHVYLVLAVGDVFCIRACTGRLHHLLWSPCPRAVVVLVRHRQLCHGRVPVDASPAQIYVVGVVAEYERVGIGRVVGRLQHFFLSE